MDAECSICGRRRRRESEFCLYHEIAKDNLRKAFESWKLSLKIDWPCFLMEIADNPITGEWCKEVANYMINKKYTVNAASQGTKLERS